MFAILFAVFFLFALVPHKKADSEASKLSTTPQGEVMFDIAWPPGQTDVDAWVKSGGTDVQVGYSNKTSLNCDLLRDDQGINDVTPLNYERLVCRKLSAGVWVLTINFYSDYQGGTSNLPVDIVVSTHIGDKRMVIESRRVILKYCSDQKTGAHFIVDDDKVVTKIDGDAGSLLLSSSCGGH